MPYAHHHLLCHRLLWTPRASDTFTFFFLWLLFAGVAVIAASGGMLKAAKQLYLNSGVHCASQAPFAAMDKAKIAGSCAAGGAALAHRCSTAVRNSMEYFNKFVWAWRSIRSIHIFNMRSEMGSVSV